MRSTNSEFEWTDGAIRKLRQLWSEGHSTAEIGRRMGISKNAVVGKAHRLDLPARPSPIRTGNALRSPHAPRRQPVPRLADTMPLSSLRGANIPTTVERIAPTPAPARRVATAPRRFGSHPCCWPIGEPGTTAFRFCDDPAPLDVPYATSMRVAPTRLVAGATRQMKYCSLNFCEHQGGFDVCGAAEATVAARVRRSKHPADRLCRLHPCPSRRPAAVEMGLQEDNGDPYAEVRTPQTQRLTATS